ncbi:DUF6468 domain-containing protein [Phenylobacterium sp.]|uniref:DUF6468 domain-containing protein n=1 Tax=Phenylobacterium sp. TaxID=1871053 RepID=UPI003569AEDC
MSIIGVALNLLLAGLLVAALGMGWRLNRRLKALRDSHDGFAVAVRELNTAAARAEQGLTDLRAATDEAVDMLADRIEKGRALAAKLERLIDHAPAPQRLAAAVADPVAERRLGALLAAAREARPDRYQQTERAAQTERLAPRQRPEPPLRRTVEDDLFDDEPLTLNVIRGAQR